MEGLRIALLDGFSVSLSGKEITSFGTRKAQALLAYLVVESARAHRRDYLAGLLWGEQPQEKALHSLRQAVSALRRVLRDETVLRPYLLTDADSVQFNNRNRYSLDVDRFGCLYRQGMPMPGQRLNPGRLSQAAELYRHPFLDQFFLKDAGVFEEWAVLKREVLSRQMNEILLKLCRFYERRREYEKARHYANRLMRLAPWSEQAHLMLMRLYVLEGNVAAAEQQFFICRHMCRRFEMEPSPALNNLYEMIHAGQVFEEHSDIPQRLSGSDLVYPVPLVGREDEMAELGDILSNPLNRLVTLHGIGGVGKTRLALELAHSQVGIFRDGVYFINLAALTNRDQLPALVARSLGLELSENQEPGRQVLSYLRKKELLLVLDNFDTLLQYKKLLLDWLQGAPDVVILLTSRERLKLALELVYSLQGLCCDGEHGSENTAAERLFLEHVRRLGVKKELEPEEHEALLDICRQVEGLPLALELAAAAVWNHSLPEIAASIRQNMAAIAVTYQDVAPRHRSLWSTFEYSTRLLTEEQFALFQRLSLFPAGFSCQAVMQICNATRDTLLALVDKSLVRSSGAGRYDMHLLTHQYACHELRMNVPLFTETRQAFIEYFHRYVVSQDAAAINSSLSQAVHSIERELPAILKACRWMAEQDEVERLHEMLPALSVFYSTQSRYSEALAFLNQMLSLTRSSSNGSVLRIRLCTYSGVFYQYLNCSEQASHLLRQNLDEAARAGMVDEQVMCLIHLAYCSQQRGDLQTAHRLAQEAVEISCRNGIAWAEAESYYVCGQLAYRQGNTEQASAYLEQSLEMGRRFDAPMVIMPALNLLADVACHRGEYLRGEQMLKECLSLSQELGSRYHQAVHLNNLGTIYQLQGDYDRAGMLYEQSLEKCISIGAGTREGIVRSNLGEIAMLRGEEEQAEICYRQAYDIGCDIHDSFLMTVSLNNLAEIARRQQCHRKALDWLQRSIRISSRARLYPKLLIGLYTAACVLLDQGR